MKTGNNCHQQDKGEQLNWMDYPVGFSLSGEILFAKFSQKREVKKWREVVGMMMEMRRK